MANPDWGKVAEVAVPIVSGLALVYFGIIRPFLRKGPTSPSAHGSDQSGAMGRLNISVPRRTNTHQGHDVR